MSRPVDAVVHGDTAYFRAYRSRKMCSYNLTYGGWSKLAKCCVEDSSLVMLPVDKGGNHFCLHTIGGIKCTKGPDEEYTDDIYQLTEPARREWKCLINLKLKTKRSLMTVVFSNDHLIIAGGNSALGPVNTVDVLNVTYQKKVWCEVASLPYKVVRASGCVCNGMLYLLGGYVVNGGKFVPTRNACVATVSLLVKSHSANKDIFNAVKDLELYDSACVSFSNHILAIGGSKTDKPEGTKLVHVYDTNENVWKELNGKLSRPRCLGFAVAFEDKKKIMTVGGYNRPNGAFCTDSVEFASIK